MVDQAHTKENEAKETIQRLKTEINNLTKLVEQSAGMSMGQEHKSVTTRSVVLYIFFSKTYSNDTLLSFLALVASTGTSNQSVSHTLINMIFTACTTQRRQIERIQFCASDWHQKPVSAVDARKLASVSSLLVFCLSLAL